MTIIDSIYIHAAPAQVWAVTADVERWPEWTPTVTSVKLLESRPIGLGSVARVKQPMQPESDWTVTDFADGQRFAWETRRAGLHFKGTHEITPEGSGTRNILRIDAQGSLVVLLRPLLRLAMAKALRDENRGLKAFCEAI